jgi:hypothetical protein
MEGIEEQGNTNLERVGENWLTRIWNNEFQLATMEVNTTISLFTTMFDIEKTWTLMNPTPIQQKQHCLSWNVV